MHTLLEPMIPCPTEAALAEHARGGVPAGEGARLDQHLADCPACLERFFAIERTSPAQSVHDCHIVKEIGRGRFGVVYKAWWLNEKPRIVALKILHSHGEMERNRFDREIAVLKKLDSPWIVKCLDAGDAGDSAHFIMEFVEGAHLDDFLADRSRSLDIQLEVFERICRAVADAHAHGVVHRDLKPRNILIDDRNQPHILDFGICSVNAPDWSSAAQETLTHPGDIIGTLRYMSPEQAWGGAAGVIDHRSDIWALGIMLYEIVTAGGYPYSLGSTPEKPAHEALIDRIRKVLPVFPKLDHLERGRDLRVLLERCLAWDPGVRLGSAAALADDLCRLRERRPILTRPLPLHHRARRIAIGLAARSRWVFASSLVAGATALLWCVLHVGRVGWYVRGTEYSVPAPTTPAAAGTTPARNDLVVAGVLDETTEAIVAYATEHGLPDVTDAPATWRAVHAHLMHRLVDVRPRAVLWDYYFEKPRSADAELATAAETLERAGVPVVFSVSEYKLDGQPHLSPTLVERLGRRLRHGAITARDMVQRPGEVVLVTKSDENAIAPSAAVAMLVALLHPDCRPEFEWHGREPALTVLYEIQPGAYLRARDRLELSRVFRLGLPGDSVPSGPLHGCTTFELTPPGDWERRIIPYDVLLTGDLNEIRDRLAGKLILVGDLRRPRFGFAADRHRVAYGARVIEDVPGVFLLADALSGLLEGRYVKPALPMAPYTFVALLVLSIGGCLAPIPIARKEPFDRPTTRHRLAAGLGALSLGAFGAMLFTRGIVPVHLGMAAVALLLPALGTFWVEFARNRHRIHDRKRQTLESLSLSTGGTVTLPMRPGTPFPEIR